MAGSLRWRDGAWRLQVYAGVRPDGRERRITRTVRAPNTKAGRRQAEAELARLVVDVDDGRLVFDDDPTLEEVLRRWIRHRRPDWSPKVAVDHERIVRLYCAPLAGRRLSKLRGADLAALYDRLRESGGQGGRPLAPATVRRVHVVLHAALAEAVRWGLIAVNPADQVRPPKVPRPDPRPPAPADVAGLLAALDGTPVAVFVRLAATTGARRGQLVALRWADVDLEAGGVVFSKGIVDGGPGVGLVERGTKTDRSWRVALDPGTVAALRRHRATARERALAVGVQLPAGAYVFSDDVASRAPWRPDSVSARWRRARAGTPLEGVPLKDLRHMVATQLLAAGVDVRTVAGRLGHATPTLTMSTYAAWLPERDQAAAGEIGRLLDAAAGGGEDRSDGGEGRSGGLSH